MIAAINAVALGGGLELAMACHIRILADRARVGQPETNLGIIPGWGGTQRLTRLVGAGKAIELILTGDMINAQEAFRLGLANKVVPAGQVLHEAMGLAKKIAGQEQAHQPGHAATRSSTGCACRSRRACVRSASRSAKLIEQQRYREGLTAFLEKRQAKFTDS